MDPSSSRERGERPGWNGIINAVARMLTDIHDQGGVHRTIQDITVENGALTITADDPPELIQGILAGAAAVSRETCDACGGKGDPVADARGAPDGARCQRCRAAGTLVLERPWDATPIVKVCELEYQDARSPMASDALPKNLRGLMDALDDERTINPWTGDPGWAGLVRALFLMMASANTRQGVAANKRWLLESMKEKFGALRLHTTGWRDHHQGAEALVYVMSALVCSRCGQPGKLRFASWVRCECDDCWRKAGSQSHAQHEEAVRNGVDKEWQDSLRPRPRRKRAADNPA